MAQGFKSGGRRKGTPNKSTEDARTKLEALGCDPIVGMAGIAMDTTADPALRGRMYSELAGYVYPKRRAIEAQVSHDVKMPQTIDASRLTWEQREHLRELVLAAMAGKQPEAAEAEE